MARDDVQTRIQLRAYELWEAEGRPSGCALAHWLRAEGEINGRLPYPQKQKSSLSTREKLKRSPPSAMTHSQN